MEYIELSIKNVEEKSKELYERIVKEYPYDLVIFIARGSFYIGKVLAEENQVPLLEVFATRKGNHLKKLVKPILTILPKSVTRFLRKTEVKSSVHQTQSERSVSFDEEVYAQYKDRKNILLVDDSIDTGNSVMQVLEVLRTYFPESEIKIAVFNYFENDLIEPDYSLYKETMLQGPWSNDSKENRAMTKMYEAWKTKNR